MWNLRFYEHIYKAILIRLPPPIFSEGNVTTGRLVQQKPIYCNYRLYINLLLVSEGRMLTNARSFLEMAIRQIAEDLNIFNDPNHIKEKLAQKRNQCDIK
jgi:hypothetical protein